jgi:hypothetical protein
VTVAATVLVVTACGGGAAAPVDVSVAAVRGAPAATAAAGPARLQVRVDLAGDEIEVDGVVDDADGGAADIRMVTPDRDDVHTIVIGDVTYRRLSDDEMSTLGVSTRWASVDRRRGGDALRGGIPLDVGTDPTGVLGALAGVGRDDVRRVGREEVRGVRTTRYDVDIDVASLVEASSVELEGADLEDLGDIQVEFDVWLDADGVIHRFATELGLGIGPSMSMRAELFDHGEVEPPAPPDRTEVTDFTGRLDELERLDTE